MLLGEQKSVALTMKRMGELRQSPIQVDASYSRDPTRATQRNRYKNRSRDKICACCNGSPHSRDKCPARNETCNYCRRGGHFERACLKKERVHRATPKCQNAVNVISKPDYSDQDRYGLGSVDIKLVNSPKSPREALALVKFHCDAMRSRSYISHSPYVFNGKVDTGAMVSCMPLSML